MILLFIFITGCFVTAIVALGMVFAMAAAGYGRLEWTADSAPDEDSAIDAKRKEIQDHVRSS